MIDADFAIKHTTRPAHEEVRDARRSPGASTTRSASSATTSCNVTVLPVSLLHADTIMNAFADDSVSALFGGDTQLF